MAIFHCQAKAISRKEGRSATAASAYRSGDRVKDERTGEVHDYQKRDGVEHVEVFCPHGLEKSRSELWNMAELAEKRKDAKVAREWEIALPDELSNEQRKELACTFGKALVERYGIGVDVCIHAPGKEGDQRNHHAHILTTTRVMDEDGKLGAKVRVLDSPLTSGKEVEAVRRLWADMANQALERAGHEARIDPRTLEAQGIERMPTRHMGRAATAIQRRGEEPRRKAVVIEREEQALTPEQQEERAGLDGQIAFFQKAADGVKDFRAGYIRHQAELVEAARAKAEKIREQEAEEAQLREEGQKRAIKAPEKPVGRKRDNQEWER